VYVTAPSNVNHAAIDSTTDCIHDSTDVATRKASTNAMAAATRRRWRPDRVDVILGRPGALASACCVMERSSTIGRLEAMAPAVERNHADVSEI
jgi:hypothetical protein